LTLPPATGIRWTMANAPRSPAAPAEGVPAAAPAARLAAAVRRAAELARRLLALGRRPASGGPPVPPGAGVPPVAARGRVLLVEDDALVARAVGRIIGRLGHEVTTCHDGAEALARFREDPARFDLVLTDETLPGLRGDELAPALLALRPALPVLICTGYSDRLDEERARALGARALLMKPLDVSQLEAALDAALAAPAPIPGPPRRP
jgi:CheY-like chemotaxis protein